MLLLLSLDRSVQAQTCCSGGVPVSSNLGLPSGEIKTLQFNLTYDLNVLKTLKSGKKVLDDNLRNRKTQSAIFEIGYSFTNRFSVDALFSFVRQERSILFNGKTDSEVTNGLGDATLLFKYNLVIQDQYSITPGIGIKMPTGASDLKDKDGISLNADLQPGSGAWDGIAWIYFDATPFPNPNTVLFGNLIYSLKGHNRDYLGVQDYKFGNESQISLGISRRIIVGNQLFDPSLVFRFRKANADNNDGIDLPSTGGQWIFINPSLTYWIHPDFSFNGNIDLPLMSNIEGTQVTPTYRLNMGFYYRVNFKKDNHENIPPF